MQTATRGERLLALRHLLGLHQQTLAEMSGISQPYLSLMERGERPVSDEAVNVLAATTQMPTTFFDVPGTAQGTQAVTFRKLASASAASRDAALARFTEAERIAENLADAVKFRTPVLPLAEDDLNGDDIERLADETRSYLRLELQDPIRNLTRAMERTGIAFAPLVETGDPDGLMNGHDGISRPTQIRVRPLIGYVPGKPGDRERFSKGHELGHIVLHSLRPWVLEKIKEREANRFAGALLFPKSVAVETLSDSLGLNGYVTLKAQWGISIQALINRAKDLDLISDSRNKSLWIQLSSKGWRKTEPVAVDNEKPLLLWQLLSNQFGHSPYMKASHKLGMRPDFLREWIPSGSMGQSTTSSEEPKANVIRLFG